jgi:hypothetical protein
MPRPASLFHNNDWKAAKKHLPKAVYLRQWTIKQASHAIPLDTLETVLRRNGSLHGVHFTSQIPWVQCATLTLRMQAYLQRNQRAPELLVAKLDEHPDKTSEGGTSTNDQDTRVTPSLFPLLFLVTRQARRTTANLVFTGTLTLDERIGPMDSRKAT